MISSPRPMTALLTSTVAGCALLAQAGTAQADAPSVVTTIKPLHSIASAVMAGVGNPLILIDGAASPHGFALKPSQAFLLQGADVVFWVGPELSPSLAKPIESMAENASVIEMMDAPGVSHLALREGANFDDHDHDHGGGNHAEAGHDHDDHGQEEHVEAEHDHDDHGHEEHAEAGHDHDDHGHEEHAEAGHDHDDHSHKEARDVHIWLNPDNGIAIAAQMAATLAKVDPDNAATYQKNAAAFAERIETLEHEIEHALEPAAGKAFIVFHDAYHHFEHHFDIEASGSITLSPETLASAERVERVRQRIKELNVTCVFQEPQFDAKLVNVVIEGSDARIGTLDPLGTQLENGPDLYPNLLKELGASLSGCLDGNS